MNHFAHLLPPHQFSCGNCGKTFATKTAKRKHKANPCHRVAELPEIHDGSQDAFGRLAFNISPEIKARAAAEWAAMDSEGRLPEGWTYGETA